MRCCRSGSLVRHRVRRGAALLVALALALPVGTAAVSAREGIVVCRDGAFVRITAVGEPARPPTGHDGHCCLLTGACCAGRDPSAALLRPAIPTLPVTRIAPGRSRRESRRAAAARPRPWSRAPPPAPSRS